MVKQFQRKNSVKTAKEILEERNLKILSAVRYQSHRNSAPEIEKKVIIFLKII